MKKMEEQNGIWFLHNSAKMELRGVKRSLVEFIRFYLGFCCMEFQTTNTSVMEWF